MKLILLNGVAVTVYVTFAIARNLPLGAFPTSWRPALLRWRRARRSKGTASQPTAGAAPRKDPFTASLPPSDACFKAFPALNGGATAASAGLTTRRRLEPELVPLLFQGDGLHARFSRALAERRAIDRKEFFESWECFEQIRGSMRCTAIEAGKATLLEAAAGHGLLGVLCAVFEWRRFARVVITDRRRPASFDQVLAAAVEVAPWVAERITYVEAELGAGLMPAGGAVVCVHGCKSLTDVLIEVAMEASVESIACMPCCYGHSAAAERAPSALRKHMGVALAADVHRTYRLEGGGYDVNWRHIPSAITPMNRILTARRRQAACQPCLDVLAVSGPAAADVCSSI
jgi:hypothetical protein